MKVASRHIIRKAVLLVVLVLSGVAGCTGDTDQYGGVLELSRAADGGIATDVKLQNGYVNNQKIEYYDFGNVTPSLGDVPAQNGMAAAPGVGVAVANPMYWFFDKGTGAPLFGLAVDDNRRLVLGPGNMAALAEADPSCYGVTTSGPCQSSSPVQHPIVDTIPGYKSDYTGFWEVVKVKIERGYVDDAIKSAKTLKAIIAAGDMEPSGIAINCPILDINATIVPGTAPTGRIYADIRFWYRRQLGHCILVEGGGQEALALLGPGDQPTFPAVSATTMMGFDHVLALRAAKAYFPIWAGNQNPMNSNPSDFVPNNLIEEALPFDPMTRYTPFVRLYVAPVDPNVPPMVTSVPPNAAPATPSTYRNLSIRAVVP